LYPAARQPQLPPSIDRARGRRMPMRRPPSTIALCVLPPRTARRWPSWRPAGPHRALRSSSIIAARTCLPVSTHRPKNALSASSRAESSGSGIWTVARFTTTRAWREDFYVGCEAMVAPSWLLPRPYHTEGEGAATFIPSGQQLPGHPRHLRHGPLAGRLRRGHELPRGTPAPVHDAGLLRPSGLLSLVEGSARFGTEVLPVGSVKRSRARNTPLREGSCA
jgi:hypothetical protein